MWGIVGNNTDAASFVATLEQFWLDLLCVEDGPLSHEHILVFHEPEQSEQASAIEISLEEPDEPVDRADAKLVVTEHEDLPFAWMQF